ncbi:hypothetical protein [Salinicoccus albus]|uniref:hypothetical protein n=1 Tax=Salinicoccus albus TaxID=418756 RepID=UPI0003788E18|nr:hypothetical protein [Salinicoccus albus]
MLYQFIVYAKKENLMLFDVSGEEWNFPHFYALPFHIADIKKINEYFNKQYNLFTNVLKCWKKEDSRLIYEVEVLDTDHLPAYKYSDWAAPSSANIFNAISVKEKWILQQWKEGSDYQMPWFQYGFREKTEEWVESKLLGRFCLVEQVRTWEKGLLLKIHGFNNNYYVKTVPPIFGHEPFVHQSMTKYAPEVISIDEKRKTYMMREINGELLGYSEDIQQWKMTVRRIAELQKKYIQGELKINRTIPIRPVHTIINEERLHKTISALENYISNTSYQNLFKSIPDVLSLVQTLKFKTLLSVDHGDLFGGNVIVEGGEPLIYDWSDSSLTHPFLSIVHLTEEVETFFSPTLSEEVLSAYIDEWEGYGQKDELISEFLIVQLLQPIYYIIVYLLIISPSLHDNIDKEEVIDGYITKWIDNISEISGQT